MRLATAIVAAGLAMSLAACSHSERRDDAAISADVKKQLADERVPGAIQVSTIHAVVTLDGTVPTADVRDKAQGVAKDVKGVDRVVNNLRTTTAADAPLAIPANPNAPMYQRGMPPAANPNVNPNPPAGPPNSEPNPANP